MSQSPRRFPPEFKKDATPTERGLVATAVATALVGTLLAFGAVTGQLPSPTCDGQGVTATATSHLGSTDCR